MGNNRETNRKSNKAKQKKVSTKAHAVASTVLNGFARDPCAFSLYNAYEAGRIEINLEFRETPNSVHTKNLTAPIGYG